MQRIRFGAVLLALLLALGLFSSTLMKKAWQKQSKNLCHAAVLASDGDWATARTLQEDAKKAWDEKQLLVAALFRHEAIDQIDGLFAQLDVFSESRRTVSFSSTCVYLSQLLEALGESHSLTLKNLL